MTGTLVQPYLTFGGRCEEAIAFYRSAIGAQVEMLMRFNESPEPPPPGTLKPGFEKKVMHAAIRIGDSVIMASDGCGDEPGFGGFSLSLGVNAIEDAEKAFTALAQGGKITMPLAETFWSPRFGMLTDRFGVSWMINVAPAS